MNDWLWFPCTTLSIATVQDTFHWTHSIGKRMPFCEIHTNVAPVLSEFQWLSVCEILMLAAMPRPADDAIHRYITSSMPWSALPQAPDDCQSTQDCLTGIVLVADVTYTVEA